MRCKDKPNLIEAISAYKTSDGQLFESFCKAASHQHLLDIRESVSEWVDETLYAGIQKHDIIDLMIENKNSLIKALGVGHVVKFESLPK